MAASLRRIEQERARLERRLEKLGDERIAALREKRWKCRAAGCGRTSKLSSVVLIQTHWYTAPFSCSGGDYWNAGERNLVCPKCSVRHRMIETDPRPENFYDLSYAKRKEIEKAERPVEERRLDILDSSTRRQVFDQAIDDYDGSYYSVRLNGEDVAERSGRRTSYGRAEICDIYALDAKALATFVNV